MTAFDEVWVSGRSGLKLLDCTIRDGGLMNNHRFNDKIVKAVFKACASAGIDVVEIGYRASKRIFAPSDYGKWKYCSEEDVRRVIEENETDVKLSVMADAERTDYHEDIPPKEKSVFDIIRVSTYVHQLPEAVQIIQDAHQKGYFTTANIMAVSKVTEAELDRALELLVQTEAKVLYLVDSYGALYPHQVRYLIEKYEKYARPEGKLVGMHAHNNQELAFANTLEAILAGADIVDGTLAGLGRGAGNCRLESLVSYLRNSRYQLAPLLECIADVIEPLRDELKWGFDVPYLLTGVMNRHPSSAINFNNSGDRGNYLKFYNLLLESE